MTRGNWIVLTAFVLVVSVIYLAYMRGWDGGVASERGTAYKRYRDSLATLMAHDQRTIDSARTSNLALARRLDSAITAANLVQSRVRVHHDTVEVTTPDGPELRVWPALADQLAARAAADLAEREAFTQRIQGLEAENVALNAKLLHAEERSAADRGEIARLDEANRPRLRFVHGVATGAAAVVALILVAR